MLKTNEKKNYRSVLNHLLHLSRSQPFLSSPVSSNNQPGKEGVCMLLHQHKQRQVNSSPGHLLHWFHSKQHKEISPAEVLSLRTTARKNPNPKLSMTNNERIQILTQFCTMLNTVIKRQQIIQDLII